MDNPQELTVLSLCTGYGGLELGLSRALENPLRVVAVEIEAYALANLVAKAEAGDLAIEALYPDLKTFPAERFSGCFDFILAGYPCQPFSVAGKRQGTEDPRHLWPHIARIVQAIRPVWCFFENVAGHLTLGFPEVYCSLRDMGYSVEAGLFTASEVGAPHKRQRLFILAHRGQLHGHARKQEGQSQMSRGQQHLVISSNDGMADASGEGRKERRDKGRIRETQREPRPTIDGGCDKWPARPGQPQYEWEEPRVVVGNPASTRKSTVAAGSGSRDTIGESSSELEDPSRLLRAGLGWQVRRRRGVCGTSEGQAERLLGGEPDERPAGVDPVANRVDRLRLLGNGCVPAQAAKAFRELRCVTNTTR